MVSSIGGMVVLRRVRITVLRPSCGVIVRKTTTSHGDYAASMSQSAVLPPRRRFQSTGVVRHLLSLQSTVVTSNGDPATISEGGTTTPAPIIKAVNNIISTNNPRIKYSTIVTETPHLVLMPKSLLLLVTNQNEINTTGDDSFVVTAKDYNRRNWFHATYTDSTGEMFMSGLAQQVTIPTTTNTKHLPTPQASSSSSSTLKSPLHLAETKIFDGKVYYSRIKMAEHAAAARAIDCYIHRENNVIVLPNAAEEGEMSCQSDTTAQHNKLVPQLCFETPYSTIEEGISQNPIDYDTLLSIKQNHVDVVTMQRPFFTETVNASTFLLHVPKVLLTNAIQRGHYYIDWASSFTVHKHENSSLVVDDNSRTWYTATFTHPITNEIFTSGLSREVFVKRRNDSSLHPPLHMVDATVIDNKVYYCNSGKLAQHAAAARAIDCYLYREEKEEGDSKKWRLCYEEPYRTPEEGKNVTIDYNTLLVERDTNNSSQILSTTSTTGRSFSSSIKCMSHSLHVPKTFLSKAFSQKHHVNISDDCYHVKEREYDDITWYTSTFTDPNTLERFNSGLGNVLRVKSHPDSTDTTTPLHMANVEILDGEVYYRESILAQHAAAARAIDSYIYREGNVNDRGHHKFCNNLKLCMEAPYAINDGEREVNYASLLQRRDRLSMMNEAALFDVDFTGLTEDDEHATIEIRSSKVEEGLPMSSINRSFSYSVQLMPHELHVPMEFLSGAYLRVYYRKYGGGATATYSVKVREYDDKRWYTAIFTDPCTNEQFASGLGNIVNFKSRPGRTLKIPLYQADVKVLDGVVYYNDKKLAKHAAAARAIDCYLLREQCDDGIRLCLEDPYSTAEDGVSQSIDYDALLLQKDELLANDDNDTITDTIPTEESTDVGDCKWFTATFTDPITRDENSMKEVEIFELDSSDDDLPVLTIPFVNGVNTVVKVNHNMSTMGRILEIWAETTGHDSSSEQFYSKSTRQNESPSARIRSILNWYKRVNNDPKSKEEAFALARLCIKILTALGDANCDQQLEGKDCVNIQKNAKTILDKIISLSISFDKYLVDADTFTAYIRCLNRENPAYSAELAEFLLKSMQSNEYYRGINLPLPNVDTFNAVIGLWGLVDGGTGQSCANRVYSLLNSAYMTRIEEHPIHPNEETFRLLMSVNSKKDSQFSFEHAKSWLQSFPNLVADVDVYSAALSTLSTNTSSDSLDPRYANSWISYGRQYVRGFKSAGTSLDEEAEEISKWLLYAEECGIHPNADMYEAVIRAWIKTGTKNGLLSAEDWAKRAVSSNSRIRIETFHPIIAAWALCQFERAPARVEEWTNQLTGLSGTKPHLKPDLQTLSALIISWRNVQAGIIARANEKTLSDSIVPTILRGDADEKSRVLKDVEMVFTSAENCMQHLTDLYPRSKLDNVHDTMAMTSMFTHTIEAWGCASRFAQLYNSMGSASLDTSHGVHEMLKVHRLLDAKIENTIGTDDEDVLTTLQLMGENYAETIAQLHQIDTALDSQMISTTATTTPFFSREIADVERMLYEYDLYSRTHYPEGNFTLESNALRHRLYKEILRGCTGVKSSADYGHVIRLCRLIMDQLSWLDERCLDNNDNNSGNTFGNYTSFVKDDVTDIFVDMALLAGTTITNEHERTYVLSVMWNNAKHFFEWNSSRYEGGSSSNSNYATVDKARLIGAMRMAMKDSELTEPFLRNFDKRPPKRKGRGNSWLAFVEDILRKGD